LLWDEAVDQEVEGVVEVRGEAGVPSISIETKSCRPERMMRRIPFEMTILALALALAAFAISGRQPQTAG
jgi:hypothetical protein